MSKIQEDQKPPQSLYPSEFYGTGAGDHLNGVLLFQTWREQIPTEERPFQYIRFESEDFKRSGELFTGFGVLTCQRRFPNVEYKDQRDNQAKKYIIVRQGTDGLSQAELHDKKPQMDEKGKEKLPNDVKLIIIAKFTNGVPEGPARIIMPDNTLMGCELKDCWPVGEVLLQKQLKSTSQFQVDGYVHNITATFKKNCWFSEEGACLISQQKKITGTVSFIGQLQGMCQVQNRKTNPRTKVETLEDPREQGFINGEPFDEKAVEADREGVLEDMTLRKDAFVFTGLGRSGEPSNGLFTFKNKIGVLSFEGAIESYKYVQGQMPIIMGEGTLIKQENGGKTKLIGKIEDYKLKNCDGRKEVKDSKTTIEIGHFVDDELTGAFCTRIITTNDGKKIYRGAFDGGKQHGLVYYYSYDSQDVLKLFIYGEYKNGALLSQKMRIEGNQRWVLDGSEELGYFGTRYTYSDEKLENQDEALSGKFDKNGTPLGQHVQVIGPITKLQFYDSANGGMANTIKQYQADAYFPVYEEYTDNPKTKVRATPESFTEYRMDGRKDYKKIEFCRKDGDKPEYIRMSYGKIGEGEELLEEYAWVGQQPEIFQSVSASEEGFTFTFLPNVERWIKFTGHDVTFKGYRPSAPNGVLERFDESFLIVETLTALKGGEFVEGKLRKSGLLSRRRLDQPGTIEIFNGQFVDGALEGEATYTNLITGVEMPVYFWQGKRVTMEEYSQQTQRAQNQLASKQPPVFKVDQITGPPEENPSKSASQISQTTQQAARASTALVASL